ncbi:mediator of RNA polymerase II transcription subunit 16-like [Diaphorina citri]|uniref:Mediator of RNA polymerase II transcription subunit 16 n=1 Tax=Diaphorina citri TaxID=121845 RepID=A0A3Q0JG29_DIACI|nr:mediator of RNA polymerase II transcription subunit 16-like [Diaphorina citri]
MRITSFIEYLSLVRLRSPNNISGVWLIANRSHFSSQTSESLNNISGVCVGRYSVPGVYKVARVRFIVREDADSVIVAANGETNSVIEVWELVENAYPVNSVFKKSVSLGVGPPAGDPGLKTITWRLQNSYAYEAKVLSVTTSKLCVSNSLPPQAHIIVAYSNGSLTCFLKDSLKQLGFTSVNNMIWAKLDNMKRSRMSVVLSCIDLSWLGNVLA